MASAPNNLWTTYERPNPNGQTIGRTGLIGIHTHVLANSKVMTWEGHNANTMNISGQHETHAYQWNPNKNATGYPNLYDHVDNYGANIFCAGHTLLPDGRLFSAGGHYSDGLLPTILINGVRTVDQNATPPDLYSEFQNGRITGDIGSGYIGLKDTYIYNYAGSANTTLPSGWRKMTDMSHRRWYPTATTQSNGNVLVVAGQEWGNAANPNDPIQAEIPEVWQATSTSAAQPNLDDWRQLTTASKKLPLYPWMYQAPDGRVFNAGPNLNTGFLDTEANGGTGLWANTPIPSSLRTYERGAGTSVMYRPGRIFNIGGEQNGVHKTTELIDLASAVGTSPVFKTGLDMLFPRMHVNSTLLADGTVLITGGSSLTSSDETGAVYNAELWTPPNKFNPVGTWSLMAPMQKPRLYHSIALLLPDATVLSTGGGQGGGYPDQPTWEIFTPPYLCKGYNRPQISSAPQAVAYGQTFVVRSPNAASIARATWVRLSSVTHSFNMNQRFMDLFPTYDSASPNELIITAPTNPNNSPPGHYMLFLVDGNGTPSLASIMSINTTVCPNSLVITQSGTGGSQSTCQTTTRFTASGGATNTYYWLVNGAAYSGTGNYIDLVTSPGASTVQVQAMQNGCGASSTLTSYFPACTQ